jgi:hypothetical protein
MARELWPRPPGQPTESGVSDFERWGEAAPFVAQAEYLHSQMCTMSRDIDAFGADVGDTAVVNWIVNRLAGIGLTIADIVRSLSTRLNWATINPDHTLEVMEAFDRARHAFAEACEAAQAATETLRNHTQTPG